MNKLVIIGAGGHGRVAADIARLNGYSEIRFLDDNPDNKLCKVDGGVSSFADYNKEEYEFFVAIGNNVSRRKILQMLIEEKVKVATLIHPAAVVCDNVKFGIGSVVMAGAVINTNAVIGNGVIINTSSSVDHDCVIGDYTHIAVGAHIAGTVKVGEGVFICAGVTVINNVSVCSGCVIGAGAVVIKSIEKSGTYIGVVK